MPNRLAAEASPYLRQHADNPVDWWPWSASALEAARAQGKPILLSIGYSACHWCHVMAHESFEDGATAALMNDLYICVKVDREERPDIDKIYQLAHQALTRRAGGWPLTVFLTPDDHLPFYAGTYFPREARYGMPPFAHVLQQVHAWWDTRREEVRAQNAALAEFLADHGKDSAIADALHDAPLGRALTQIEAHFDSAHGGHLGAPKFPHCTEMELLLDLDLEPLLSGSTPGAPPFKVSHERDNPGPHPALRATSSPGENGQAPALRPRDGSRGKQMVLTTLHHIAAGGIHDQIGGGFARYSVDERWEIPHFEKMLYDNAQLLPLYSRLASHAAQFADAADGIVTWLGREMTAPDGGFYSALDADSEHEEGKFYVWQRAQVRALFGDDEYAVALRYYGFDRPANFENHAWNPIVARSLDDVAAELGIDRDRAQTLLSRARAMLFEARSARVRPGLDDKILTAWNALMIGALARASRTVQGAQATAWLTLAERALDCVQRSAWRDGRLYAKAGSDAQRFPGYLDDHAFLLDALLELLQCRWSERDFAWALQLAQQLLERFEDRVHGGFYFTAHDHEQLIQRPKPWSDEATPSGNGVAARALQRLGHLLGDTRYLDAAERTLRAGFDTLQQMPQACCSLLRALGDVLAPRTHVVVRCADAAQERDWRAALAAVADTRTDVYFVPAATSGLLGALAAQAPAASGIAYICRGTHCLPPVRDADAAAALLREGT